MILLDFEWPRRLAILTIALKSQINRRYKILAI